MFATEKVTPPAVQPNQVSTELAVYIGYLLSLQPGQTITFTDESAFVAVHGKALDKNYNPETGITSLSLIDDPNHDHAND